MFLPLPDSGRWKCAGVNCRAPLRPLLRSEFCVIGVYPCRSAVRFPDQMTTWIGTSGFQYAEWKGNFYPEDLAAAKMLPYYAERLNTTEINYTFHRIPSAKTIANWNTLTPAR